MLREITRIVVAAAGAGLDGFRMTGLAEDFMQQRISTNAKKQARGEVSHAAASATAQCCAPTWRS